MDDTHHPVPPVPHPLSIKAHCLEVIESSDLADPREIAAKVLDQRGTCDRDRRDLADVLPGYVRVLLSQHRRDAHRQDRAEGATQAPSDHSSSAPSAPTSSGAEQPPIGDANTQTSTGDRSAPGSARWRQAASGFRLRYSVGNTWKLLADVTVLDTERIIHDYQQRARQNSAHAARWERVRERMLRDGATIVAELPEDWVVAVLRGEEPPEPASVEPGEGAA